MEDTGLKQEGYCKKVQVFSLIGRTGVSFKVSHCSPGRENPFFTNFCYLTVFK